MLCGFELSCFDLLVERQPLLPVFGEALPIQYQRAERQYDDDEERDLEAKRYKYVLSEPRKRCAVGGL